MTKFRRRKNLRAEFLYHLPENDKRIIKRLLDYETQLLDAKSDTNGGFFNDTTPKKYNEEEAELARSIQLFKDKLIDKRFDSR